MFLFLCFMVSVVGIIQHFLYGFRRFLFLLKYLFFLFTVPVAGFLVDSAAAGGSIILECIKRFLVFDVFLGLVSVAVFCLWFPSWRGNYVL